MKKLILSTALAAGVAVVGTSAFAGDVKMITINVGYQKTPMEVVMILYNQRDPGTTIEDFHKTNPQYSHIGVEGFLEPLSEFQVPARNQS